MAFTVLPYDLRGTNTGLSALRHRVWIGVSWWLAVFCGATGLPAATTMSVSGRQILLNGQPFLMRGVCYQPTPIGQDPSLSEPYGDYYTTNAPYDFRSIYNRDLPLLRQMGANTIRVYSWNLSRSHTDFLNKAYNNGVQPIYVLVNRWVDPTSDWSNANEVNVIKNDYLSIVANVNNHPAVIGYAIGNEMNRGTNGSNTNFWKAINTIAAAVKARAPDRLVTTPLSEGVSQITNFNSIMTNLDVWSVQAYRGSSFGTLFSTYQSASTKPLLLTEFGIDAYDNRTGQLFTNNAQAVADCFQSLWQQVLVNRSIASGGCVFSYTDEWWKATGTTNVHNTGGFTNTLFPDDFVNEEWWGIFGVQDNGGNPDILQPRAMFSKIQEFWTPPRLSATPAFASNRLRTTFTRRADRRDLKYEVEATEDFASWTVIARSDQGGVTTNVNNGSSILETGSGNERSVTVVNAVTAANVPIRFNRVKVTQY